MYRSVAWKFLQTGMEFDEVAISKLAQDMVYRVQAGSKHQ